MYSLDSDKKRTLSDFSDLDISRDEVISDNPCLNIVLLWYSLQINMSKDFKVFKSGQLSIFRMELKMIRKRGLHQLLCQKMILYPYR